MKHSPRWKMRVPVLMGHQDSFDAATVEVEAYKGEKTVEPVVVVVDVDQINFLILIVISAAFCETSEIDAPQTLIMSPLGRLAGYACRFWPPTRR